MRDSLKCVSSIMQKDLRQLSQVFFLVRNPLI